MYQKPVFSQNISEQNSFDFLRLLFAFSVFVAHFGGLTSNKIYFPISSQMAVSGFFIISGFLITRSFYRSKNIWDYSLKRIRRIIPAYLLVVVICAVLLSVVSSLSFQDYFTSKTFLKYLVSNVSFLNFLQPILPEVFTTNPLPFVNGSLWTIKVELCLYAFLPIIALCLRKKPVFALIGFYVFSFLYSLLMNHLADSSGNSIYDFLQKQFPGQIRFFVSGAIILIYFDFIVKKRVKWFLPVSAGVFLTRYFFNNPIIDFLYPFSFAVLIVCCAYYFKRISILTKYGDFSYGFYLFHFPIIQIFVHFGILKENPVLLFLVCFVIIYSLSALSWHLLEKRMLKRS
ncbi:MAG: acyltransferase [Prevotellaceae bacterium]|jgi:peptidoglycan/LPS O-acetylase OafA/YrhL|nr:acyltransferase [Prevotellaceae bacterium]